LSERKEKRREKESVKKEKRKGKGKKRRIEERNNVETNEVWESENDCMRCK